MLAQHSGLGTLDQAFCTRPWSAGRVFHWFNMSAPHQLYNHSGQEEDRLLKPCCTSALLLLLINISFSYAKTRWEVLVQDCALAKFLNNSSYSSKIVSKEEYFLEKITYQEKTKKQPNPNSKFRIYFCILFRHLDLEIHASTSLSSRVAIPFKYEFCVKCIKTLTKLKL